MKIINLFALFFGTITNVFATDQVKYYMQEQGLTYEAAVYKAQNPTSRTHAQEVKDKIAKHGANHQAYFAAKVAGESPKLNAKNQSARPDFKRSMYIDEYGFDEKTATLGDFFETWLPLHNHKNFSDTFDLRAFKGLGVLYVGLMGPDINGEQAMNVKVLQPTANDKALSVGTWIPLTLKQITFGDLRQVQVDDLLIYTAKGYDGGELKPKPSQYVSLKDMGAISLTVSQRIPKADVVRLPIH